MAKPIPYIEHLRVTKGEGLPTAEKVMFQKLLEQEQVAEQLQRAYEAKEQELADTRRQFQNAAGAVRAMAEVLIVLQKNRLDEAGEKKDGTPKDGDHPGPDGP